MGDIDDLLSEFDAIDRGDFRSSRRSSNPPPVVRPSNTSAAKENMGSRNANPILPSPAKKSDIDDLLDELDSIGVGSGSGRGSQAPRPQASSRRESMSSQVPAAGSKNKIKCTAVHLGPVSGPWGRYTGVGPAVCCENLRCTRCDFKVIRFNDAEWAPDVDYMFFRNCYPDVSRLSPKLIKRTGSSAYTCQCSWTVCQVQHRIDFTSDLRWVCAGHSP